MRLPRHLESQIQKLTGEPSLVRPSAQPARTGRGRRSGGREAAVLRGCLELLRLRGVLAIRVNCGAVTAAYRGRQRFVRFTDTPGLSDVLAVLPPHGRLLALEVKRPGGRLRPTQEAFLERVRSAGGLALVVSDIRDLEAALTECERAGEPIDAEARLDGGDRRGPPHTGLLQRDGS